MLEEFVKRTLFLVTGMVDVCEVALCYREREKERNSIGHK